MYPGYVWDSRDLGSCRAVLPSDPVFWSRHVSDAHAVGTKRPEIQNSDSRFSSVTLCILLHLLSWENVSKTLNPAGFTLPSISFQDGADVKDCSRSNIFLTISEFFCDGYFLKGKKHRNERKMLTSYLLTKMSSKLILFIVKCHIATRWAFYPTKMAYYPALVNFDRFHCNVGYKRLKLNKQCLL